MNKIRRGFTLIELLVVMTIIMLLATIGLLGYRSAMQKSRNGRRMSDLEQLRQALEMYKSEEGQYPVSGDLADLTEKEMIREIPQDPLESDYYYNRINADEYWLCSLWEGSNAADKPCTINDDYGYGVQNPL